MQRFRILVEEEAVIDLRHRLQSARLPLDLVDAGGSDGVRPTTVRRIVDRWRDGFDWRIHEARLNELPMFTTDIDGLDVQFIHRRGVGPSPMPIVVTHGWPGSFIEMESILPMLADPGAHGGDPEDAFHVVVPSLPGYGFSAAPRFTGVSSEVVARTWAMLMTRLGYDRFGAQGGDIGAGVSMWLARRHAAAMIGVHVNYVPGSFSPHVDEATAPLSAEEREFAEVARRFSAEEGAYAAIQSTKPLTLAYALTDSPVGLAAWMVEKFEAWSDHDGDLASAIPIDTILANLSLYWFSHSIDASLRLYRENARRPLAFLAGERIAVPLGVAVFPRELPMPPRRRLERVFDVSRWSIMSKGGHFAALEQPDDLAGEIRAFFRPLRQRAS